MPEAYQIRTVCHWTQVLHTCMSAFVFLAAPILLAKCHTSIKCLQMSAIVCVVKQAKFGDLESQDESRAMYLQNDILEHKVVASALDAGVSSVCEI